MGSEDLLPLPKSLIALVKKNELKELVKALTREPQYGNARDSEGASLLHHVARYGHLEVMEYLIHKVNLDPRVRSSVGATPLHDAAAAGQVGVVAWLILNAKVPLNEKDDSGCSLLHVAAGHRQKEVIRWLLQETSIDAVAHTYNGAVPLHFAAASGCLECVTLLVDRAPRGVNMQMMNGVTPTYLAAQEGHTDVVHQLVLHCGANPRLRANDGMSCIHAAAQMGRLDIVGWLIRHMHIDVNEKDHSGAAPMHFTACGGHRKLMEWLLTEKASLAPDDSGGTPLHDAAQNGHADCCFILLANGCSADVKDKQGATAADVAEATGHRSLAQALRRHMEEKATPPDADSKDKPVTNGSSSDELAGEDAKGSALADLVYAQVRARSPLRRLRQLAEPDVGLLPPPENGVIEAKELDSVSSVMSSMQDSATQTSFIDDTPLLRPSTHVNKGRRGSGSGAKVHFARDAEIIPDSDEDSPRLEELKGHDERLALRANRSRTHSADEKDGSSDEERHPMSALARAVMSRMALAEARHKWPPPPTTDPPPPPPPPLPMKLNFNVLPVAKKISAELSKHGKKEIPMSATLDDLINPRSPQCEFTHF